MNDLAKHFILISFLGKGMLQLLPRGDKNPLSSALKFMISLGMILLLSSPLFSLMKKNTLPELPWIELQETNASDLLWSKSCNAIIRDVKQSFPQRDLQLDFHKTKEGLLREIFVYCENEESGEEVVRYLERRYAVEARWIKREEAI